MKRLVAQNRTKRRSAAEGERNACASDVARGSFRRLTLRSTTGTAQWTVPAKKWPLMGRAWVGLAFAVVCLISLTSVAGEDLPVACEHIVRRSPNFSIHVVTINLADPRVRVRVAAGGPAPEGQKQWVTTLLPPTEIAAREHFDTAINGDFFGAKATRDIEGRNTGFIRGKPASPVGQAMTDGRLWHRADAARPYLEITTNQTAKIVDGQAPGAVDPAAWEIVGGGQVIVRNGHAIDFTNTFSTARHPRTVVGLDRRGQRLTLFIVDGRQPDLSIGMTLAELAHEMIALGCDSALNLDGGGSTELVWREPDTTELKIINSPSDSKERSVADVLGVTVAGGLPAAP